MALPKIIQGGMGVGVSNWRLARAVAAAGQLGVVSGTALEQVLARRLQDGDPGGHMRRGLDHFPIDGMAERVWQRYYIRGGKAPSVPYRTAPMHARESCRELDELCVVANFVEVFLAREGHGRAVGINYLEKIQLPHLPSIYGAMLAGVDYVLMGAGIPLKIPGVLDRFVHHEPATYPLTVTGAADDDDTTLRFAPRDFTEGRLPALRRPAFLAIIASNTLAIAMQRKANGRVDGFVVEGPTAGGHNAPPRGKPALSDTGEPVYGERDRVDLAALRALGLPFWLAGGYASAAALQRALDAGATGIQVGTAFALCAESGLDASHRAALLAAAADGSTRVFTDPRASPTGFPFKVARLAGSVSEDAEYLARPRICDLGYLREAYRTPEGTVGFRCAAEPVSVYLSKGGQLEETAGRKCICNALMANIGHMQVRGTKYIEKGLVTAGDDLVGMTRFLQPGAAEYSAADVVAALLMSPAPADTSSRCEARR
jgi:nitronate monooxygenase